MVIETTQPKLMAGRPLRDKLFVQIQQVLPALALAPHLMVLQVGSRPESNLYVEFKQKAAEKLGIKCTVERLPEDITQHDLEMTLARLNESANVTGILLQLPLPDHLKPQSYALLAAIHPFKDVDGLTPHNQGLLATGRTAAGLMPATPLGVVRLLQHYEIDIVGKNVCMVGASNLVGTPLARLLTLAGGTVDICHSQTTDLAAHTKLADIVLSATGVQHLIQPEMIKDGAVLVDIGISRQEQRIVGDMAPAAFAKSSAHTPVPGGVGPMTVGSLLTNVIDAVCLQSGQPKIDWQITG